MVSQIGQVLYTHEVTAFIAYARLYGQDDATIALDPKTRLSQDINCGDTFLTENRQIVVLNPEQLQRVQRFEGELLSVGDV